MEKSDAILRRLAATIRSHRNADPVKSYVATLFAKGDDAIIKKVGEEATEAVMAAKDGDKIRLTAEMADLWFHCPSARTGRSRAQASRKRCYHRKLGLLRF